MPSVTVTTTPQQFHALAGITDASRVVWTGRMQNAGRVAAGTLPATWFWTKRGTATLVFRNV